MNIRKTLATAVAASVLGTGLAVAPAIAAPASSGLVESASAVPWKPGFPSKPPRKQPVGWGDQCYVEIQQHRNGKSTYRVYYWFTTSVGGSTCNLRWVYTR